MKARVHAVLSALAVLGCATAARAEIPRLMRLEYTLEHGAERCPAEQVFRDTVGKEMSFDPFVNNAPARLVVTVVYRAGLYHGRAELHDGTRIAWEDPVKPELHDCRTVIHALGIAVAIKLDPPGAPPPPLPAPMEPSADLPPAPKPLPDASPPVPNPPLAEPPSTSARKPARKAAPPAMPLRLRCGLTGAVALWIAPSDTAFEWAMDCGVRGRIFSISTELRGSPPAGANRPLSPGPGESFRISGAEPAAYISTSRLAAALVPCVNWQMSQRWQKPTLVGCAVVQGGGMFGSAGPGLEGHPALPYFAAGGRFMFELDLFGSLSGRFGVDLLGVLSRPVFSVEQRTAFETRPFSMAIGGGIATFFD
jgi:hypothetical protein